jgi:hypothetical protein
MTNAFSQGLARAEMKATTGTTDLAALILEA